MIKYLLLVALTTTAFASSGTAQEVEAVLINDVDQATVAAHRATPYMEASTLLLADIDLNHIDVGATIRWRCCHVRRSASIVTNARSR